MPQVALLPVHPMNEVYWNITALRLDFLTTRGASAVSQQSETPSAWKRTKHEHGAGKRRSEEVSSKTSPMAMRRNRSNYLNGEDTDNHVITGSSNGSRSLTSGDKLHNPLNSRVGWKLPQFDKYESRDYVLNRRSHERKTRDAIQRGRMDESQQGRVAFSFPVKTINEGGNTCTSASVFAERSDRGGTSLRDARMAHGEEASIIHEKLLSRLPLHHPLGKNPTREQSKVFMDTRLALDECSSLDQLDVCVQKNLHSSFGDGHVISALSILQKVGWLYGQCGILPVTKDVSFTPAWNLSH